MRQWVLAGSAVLCLASGDAAARSSYASQIPALPEGCNTCHTAGGESPRNAFGEDVERTLRGGNVQWSVLFNVDSDGDGQTNGQELGDPCGEWTGGAPGRTSDVSAPGDEGALSLDPEAGCVANAQPWLEPDPRPAVVTTGNTEEDTFFDVSGGCFGNQSRNDGAVTTLGALALATLLWRRRRRPQAR